VDLLTQTVSKVDSCLNLSVLSPPAGLSANFKRFYTQFEYYINFILKWDYEILEQL
jgi:hypothetical protein